MAFKSRRGAVLKEGMITVRHFSWPTDPRFSLCCTIHMHSVLDPSVFLCSTILDSIQATLSSEWLPLVLCCPKVQFSGQVIRMLNQPFDDKQGGCCFACPVAISRNKNANNVTKCEEHIDFPARRRRGREIPLRPPTGRCNWVTSHMYSCYCRYIPL